MKNLLDLTNELKNLKEEIRQKGEKEVFEFLQGLLEINSDVVAIIVGGYTPGFNDGDACTHTSFSEVYHLQNGKLNMWADPEEYLSCADTCDEQVKLYLTSLEVSGKRFTHDREIDTIVSNMDDALEIIFNTNFIFWAVRMPDGEYRIGKSDYGCGW